MKSKFVYYDLAAEGRPLLVRAAQPKPPYSLIGKFVHHNDVWGFSPAMMVFPMLSPEMLRRLADMVDTLQAGGKLS